MRSSFRGHLDNPIDCSIRLPTEVVGLKAVGSRVGCVQATSAAIAQTTERGGGGAAQPGEAPALGPGLLLGAAADPGHGERSCL